MRWLSGLSVLVLVACGTLFVASLVTADHMITPPGEIIKPADAYPPDKGYLVVDTTPVKGEVWVAGVSYGKAPIRVELSEGTYAISYGSVEGYVAPPPDYGTIVGGTTRNIVGYYTQPEGEWSEKSIKYILIGAAIVVGLILAAAALIKAISDARVKRRD